MREKDSQLQDKRLSKRKAENCIEFWNNSRNDFDKFFFYKLSNTDLENISMVNYSNWISKDYKLKK